MEHSIDNKQLSDLGVDLLLKFGSQVTGTARPDSDYDIGVIFLDQAQSQPRRYGQLHTLVQDMFPGKTIDLVELYTTSSALQFQAATTGQPLYESTTSSFANFREHAMQRYFDFQPIIRIHEEALQMNV